MTTVNRLSRYKFGTLAVLHPDLLVKLAPDGGS